MKTVYDVRQLLKRFSIFIYTGNRIADLDLMEDELKDLYKVNLIESEEFQKAILILRHERNNQIGKI